MRHTVLKHFLLGLPAVVALALLSALMFKEDVRDHCLSDGYVAGETIVYEGIETTCP